MKISNLIRALEEMKLTHGDIPVLLEGEKISMVTFYPAEPGEHEAYVSLEI